MTEHIKRKWKEAGASIKGLLVTTVAFLMTLVVSVIAMDYGDFEDFFSVNYRTETGDPALSSTNSADTFLDYDSDNSVNTNEFDNNTDPYNPDTDGDTFKDGVDDNPLSRAAFDWGEEFWHISLTNDSYDVSYAQPIWVLSAAKVDGTWQTDPTAFFVASTASANEGALEIKVDRTELTNNVVLSLTLHDYPNSTLFVELYEGTNSTPVYTSVNILGGTDEDVIIKHNVSLESYPNADTIKIVRGMGDIKIFSTSIYVDGDNDGLDADQEIQLSTSDSSTDSDSDGLTDSEEVAYEKDPATADSYATLPFTENFETDTVSTGDIHGQNGWEASETNKALVQTAEVYAGSQALQFDSDETVAVRQLFADSSSGVWMDIYCKSMYSSKPEGDSFDTSALFHFDADGYLEVYDGSLASGSRWVQLTNATPVDVSTGEWVRLTIHLDYTSQAWLIALDGTLLANELGFASTQDKFTAFHVEGEEVELDNLKISTTIPSGLTFDIDSLPDTWEQQYFSDLDEDPTDDPDGDGLNNLGEYTAGSDPTKADTDGDGYLDGAEVAGSYDPTDADSHLFSDRSYAMRLYLKDSTETNALSNVPMLVSLDGSKVDLTQFKADGTDIAFADPSGNVVKHEIGQWDSTDSSSVWVKMAELFGSNAPDYIMMHWGNTNASDSSDAAAVWSDGFAGVYHMDESYLATTIGDSSSCSNDGANQGTTGTDGPIGGARELYYQYIDVGRPSSLIISNGITMSAWINRSSTAAQKGQGHILNMGGGWADDGYSLFYFYSNLRIELQGGGVKTYVDNTLDDDDNWHHVAATWDISDNTIRTYIDGVLQPNTTTFNSLIGTSGQNFNIGRNENQGAYAYFQGKLDEVRVANKARSASWIKFQYDSMNDDVLIYGAQEVSVAAGQNASEPSTNGTFIVSRTDFNKNIPLVVNYTVTGGTATQGTDYQALSGSVTIPAGSLSTTVPVAVIDDLWVDADETVSITIAEGNYAISSSNDSAAITIIDDEVDSDSDGMSDSWEIANFGDLSKTATSDTDNDGLLDIDEYINGTNPAETDSDNDGMEDGWEVTNGFDPLTDDASGDSDGDGLSNLNEHNLGTSTTDTDSDNDGMPDGWEFDYGLNPMTNDASADVDAPAPDGLSNLQEYQNNTDPTVADSDNDGLTDGWEVTNGTEPDDSDTDDDGVPDGAEVNTYSTDPNVVDVDTDSDGLTNDDEYNLYGTSPILADTDSDGTNDYYVALSVAPTNTSKRAGWWTEVGSELHAATNIHARVEYEVSIPDDGMYFLALNVTNAAVTDSDQIFRVQMLIDGIPLDWNTGTIPVNSEATFQWRTPWLTATNHTIRLAWPDQYSPYKLLGIKQVQIKAIDGPDADTNGVMDWMETVLEEGADSDQDGLSDEYELNTSATEVLSVDTDGDSISDGEEINLYGTDPLSLDSDTNGVNDAVLLIERDGVDTDRREKYPLVNREWTTDGTALINRSCFTAATYYNMTITNAGMYRIGLQVSNHETEPPDDYKFDLNLVINGQAVWWPTFSIFADTDVSGTGYVYTPWLTEGTHEIGVAWENDPQAGTRDANIAIEKIMLYAVDGSDADSDGIQDWMEERLAANLTKDTDKDGVTDYDEVLTHGSSPVLADSDGDGLDDSEEIAIGTDLNDTDSDNDGVDDWEEVIESKTDPLSVQFDGTVTTVDTVNGADTNSSIGVWEVVGTEIKSKDIRGSLDYELTCSTSDVYRIVVEATHTWHKKECSPVEPVDTSDVMIYVDGKYLGQKRLVAADGIYNDVRAFTPTLSEGTHTVRVFWENVHSRVALQIKQVKLQTLGGADADSDGVKDWVEESVGNITGLSDIHLGTGPGVSGSQSVVSPVCIEGAGRYIDMMSITGGGNPEVKHGTFESWYADIELSTSGQTDFTVSYQNGAVTVDTNITWVALDVLAADNQRIRLNDSLMLTAEPAGETDGTVTLEISKDGSVLTNFVTTLASDPTYKFESAGTYTVSGSFSNAAVQSSDSITVEVISASFPTNDPSCLIGEERDWACPDIPEGVLLAVDSSVDLNFTNGIAHITMNAMNKDHFIVARMPALSGVEGDEDGPILDNAQLNGCWVQGAVDSYFWKVAEYEDGNALYRNELVMKDLPDNVDIKISIFVAGATFDDLTTERWLTNADFSDTGVYAFDMLKSASAVNSVCHTVELYQDGIRIGEAYYSGVLMPEE